jgi:excisionase family DNA binding protein
MLTVAEVAKRMGRSPETVRRWIRQGRLSARKVGPQHVIDERELQSLLSDEELPVPAAWQRMPDGRPTPNVVHAFRLVRRRR